MIRLLVADDERPVVEGVSLIVKRDLADEFEVAGTASSGREAIERTRELAPDVVLMDVRMPGVTGLEAIREMRKRGSTAVFVLMTAYERFDIAREAVELGVVEYLLKPVSREALAQALRQAALVVEGRRETERAEIERREREEGLRAFVEEGFIRAVMLGERLGSSLPRYLAALGTHAKRLRVAALAFSPPPGSPDPEAAARTLHSDTCAALRYKSRWIGGPLVGRLSAAVLYLDEEDDGGKEAGALGRLLEDAAWGGRVRASISDPVGVDEAPRAWSEALSRFPADRLDGAASEREGAQPGFAVDAGFLESVSSGAPERAAPALERLLSGMQGSDAGSTPGLAGRISTLLASAARELAAQGRMDAEKALATMDLRDLLLAPDSQSFRLVALARFATIADAASRSSRRSPALSRAIEFILANFASQISLDSASAVAGVSAGRLSRLFVEETGKGFSEFLTGIRMERARELLSRPEVSIKEAAAASGYPDANYFARLFKKETGLTPSAFRGGDDVEA
ncbi:MAG: response regulator [Spirochaetales bacterium]|nr:response regulator [Spirochaetales bacterium]